MSLDEIKLPCVIQNRINELKKDKEHANVEIEFKELYKQHYLQAGTYLVDKINWDNIKCLQVLSPTYLFDARLHDTDFLDELAKCFAKESIDHTKLRDEYQLVQIKIKSKQRNEMVEAEKNIDSFWHNFFDSSDGNYANMEIFVKSLLSVSHGQADVERGFSTSSLVLTEERNAMSERTLNSRLNTIDAIKDVDKDVTKIQIDRELITLAHNAHAKYQDYLKEEKEKKKEEEREKIEKEKRREEIMQSGVERSKRRLELDELTAQIQNVNKKIKDKEACVTDVMETAEKMLAKGIENANMETVKTAKSMLEEAKKQRSEIENEKKELERLNKKKQQESGKITNFFGSSSSK